jgi:biotin-(acetyl-CoA carboxylase) ligase
VRVGGQTGIARGVSTSGELLLDTDSGLSLISAGELSLRLEPSL